MLTALDNWIYNAVCFKPALILLWFNGLDSRCCLVFRELLLSCSLS